MFLQHALSCHVCHRSLFFIRIEVHGHLAGWLVRASTIKIVLEEIVLVSVAELVYRVG